MTDPHPVQEIPLPYANVRSSGTQQLTAIHQAIYASSLLAAAIGFLPGTRILVGEVPNVPEMVIIVVAILSYLSLGLGALLGLLRVRGGKRMTIVSLAIISLELLAAPLLSFLVFGSQRFVSEYFRYYVYYGVPVLWTSAYSLVAIIALTRATSSASSEH